MRLTYSNCFLSEEQLGDVILTNEVTVAQSLGSTPVLCLDELFDDRVAERLNAKLWDLAFTWFRDGDRDPTMIHRVSVGDLAGAEAAISVLIPAARGVLEAHAALREFSPTEITVVAPTAGPGNYSRVERAQAHAFGHAVSELGPGVVCTRATSDDPRNEKLVQKFARTRDPGWPLVETPKRAIAVRALEIARAAAWFNPRAHRPSLVVAEYGPTRSFARRYARSTGRDLRLIRLWGPPRELVHLVLAGDQMVLPIRPSRRSLAARPPMGLHQALEAHGEAVRHRFVLEGVDLWPVVGPLLVDLIARYAPFAQVAAVRYRRELVRWRSAAVLVPFDTPPDARLLVRTAQALGIPTFAISDGFKGDDFSREGMAADVALAWSPALRDRFFRRRTDGTALVTGNPEADRPDRQIRTARSGSRSRILIGSFTFSPIDLNCRRSDSERYLAEVLEGIGRSSVAVDQIAIKLHPADVTDHYSEILDTHAGLPIEVVASGDVGELLDRFDLYISTYSTSLIEAVARGIAVMYYRVNLQHLHPPFRDDPFISVRTASSPNQIALLLNEPPPEFEEAEQRIRWTEEYFGPQDGRSVERIVAAIQDHARQEIHRSEPPRP